MRILQLCSFFSHSRFEFPSSYIILHKFQIFVNIYLFGILISYKLKTPHSNCGFGKCCKLMVSITFASFLFPPRGSFHPRQGPGPRGAPRSVRPRSPALASALRRDLLSDVPVVRESVHLTISHFGAFTPLFSMLLHFLRLCI